MGFALVTVEGLAEPGEKPTFWTAWWKCRGILSTDWSLNPVDGFD
jgi:hypothetical protein